MKRRQASGDCDDIERACERADSTILCMPDIFPRRPTMSSWTKHSGVRAGSRQCVSDTLKHSLECDNLRTAALESLTPACSVLLFNLY